MSTSTNPFFVEVEGNKVVGIVKEKPEAKAVQNESRRELKVSEINLIVNGLLGLKNVSCGDKCGEPLDDPEEDIYDTKEDIFDSDAEMEGDPISVLIQDQISKQLDENQGQPYDPNPPSLPSGEKKLSQLIETQLREKLGTGLPTSSIGLEKTKDPTIGDIIQESLKTSLSSKDKDLKTLIEEDLTKKMQGKSNI